MQLQVWLAHYFYFEKKKRNNLTDLCGPNPPRCSSARTAAPGHILSATATSPPQSLRFHLNTPAGPPRDPDQASTPSPTAPWPPPLLPLPPPHLRLLPPHPTATGTGLGAAPPAAPRPRPRNAGGPPPTAAAGAPARFRSLAPIHLVLYYLTLWRFRPVWIAGFSARGIARAVVVGGIEVAAWPSVPCEWRAALVSAVGSATLGWSDAVIRFVLSKSIRFLCSCFFSVQFLVARDRLSNVWSKPYSCSASRVFLVDLGDLVSIYAGTPAAYNLVDQLDYK